MLTLFVGTCRVHGPCSLLKQQGLKVRHTGHRVHAPKQALELLRHLSGTETYDDRSVHLLSSRSFLDFLAGKNAETLAALDKHRRYWPRVEQIIIEVSTLKESSAGRVVNTFTQRDLKHHADVIESSISDDRIVPIRWQDVVTQHEDPVPAMSEIAALAEGRRIIWLPHTNVPGGPRPVVLARRALHGVVSRTARELGNGFFNPTRVVSRLGAGRMFRSCDDLAHFSKEGLSALADAYRPIVCPGSPPDGATARALA